MSYKTNQERTADYLARFDRSKVLTSLVSDSPVIFDVGANVGQTVESFLNIWPKAEIHCFEPMEKAFADLAQINQGFAAQFPNSKFLSAGMSGDFEAAIKYGATHIRVGSSILGSRSPH